MKLSANVCINNEMKGVCFFSFTGFNECFCNDPEKVFNWISILNAERVVVLMGLHEIKLVNT